MYLSKKYIAKLYQAYVIPCIEYCSLCYFFNNVSKINKVENINQKILSLTNLNTQLYNIKYRLFLKCCKFLFKIHNEPKCHFLNIFNPSNISSSRSLYRIDIINSTKYKSSYCYWGSNLCNILTLNTIHFSDPYSIYISKCANFYFRQEFDTFSIIR